MRDMMGLMKQAQSLQTKMQEMQAELERLFELEELLDLSRNLLAYDPERVGGTQAKGSRFRGTATVVPADQALPEICGAIPDRHLIELWQACDIFNVTSFGLVIAFLTIRKEDHGVHSNGDPGLGR